MDGVRWSLSSTLPPDWASDLLRCGGGFFHSPLGLEAGAPAGVPVYARLLAEEGTIGIALGIRRRCRLGRSGRDHLYLPAAPAVRPGHGLEVPLRRLADHLGREGAAEVVIDSFDGGWHPDVDGAVPSAERVEHLLPLSPDPAELRSRLGSTHRRQLQRGDRERWKLERLSPPDAGEALERVQQNASERADRRGQGFRVQAPALLWARGPSEPGQRWGAAVYAARAGETLLAAALIGWAGGRAFYVMGGSTSDGYRAGAAVWLHFQAMLAAGDEGCSVYNLGGTPASAADPADPAHGLFRFKTGFGGEAARCRGAVWPLLPVHLRMHRVAHWVGSRLSPAGRP